jgi:hypothetical protein
VRSSNHRFTGASRGSAVAITSATSQCHTALGGGQQCAEVLAQRSGDHPQHIYPQRAVAGLVVGQGSLADQSTGSLCNFSLGELLPAS